MVTEIDERKGLVKTYWSDVRKRIAKVEPKFVKIVDELNPDKSFPLYLAYYPYGALKGDTQSPFIPKIEGGEYRLSDSSAPKDVVKHLGYGMDSAPLGMLLEKSLELFVDLKSENITIPRTVYRPGAFFPFTRILGKRSNRIYAPNGVLTMTSGTRSVFMLPNIGCLTNHINLQREFNIKYPPPKSLYEHWYVFKEITNNSMSNCDWRSCLIYFSEKWIQKIYSDQSWQSLKLYLHELAWQRFEYDHSSFYYDVNFSVIQKSRNLKPNPYLADTAKHLFATALGASPGYIPAIDNESLPLNVLQKSFIEIYGLKKYLPTIMCPSHYIFEREDLPIYYSLQHPSTHVFSPKSRKVSSTLFEMRELEHIMKIFIEELSKDTGMCSNTIISKIAQEIELNYFHNKLDRHKVIKQTEKMVNQDNRLNYLSPECASNNAEFASDAPFVRGCITMKRKN